MLVRPRGLEPLTFWAETRCSNPTELRTHKYLRRYTKNSELSTITSFVNCRKATKLPFKFLPLQPTKVRLKKRPVCAKGESPSGDGLETVN